MRTEPANSMSIILTENAPTYVKKDYPANVKTHYVVYHRIGKDGTCFIAPVFQMSYDDAVEIAAKNNGIVTTLKWFCDKFNSRILSDIPILSRE